VPLSLAVTLIWPAASTSALLPIWASMVPVIEFCEYERRGVSCDRNAHGGRCYGRRRDGRQRNRAAAATEDPSIYAVTAFVILFSAVVAANLNFDWEVRPREGLR